MKSEGQKAWLRLEEADKGRVGHGGREGYINRMGDEEGPGGGAEGCPRVYHHGCASSAYR